jgi:hypothetical protein
MAWGALEDEYSFFDQRSIKASSASDSLSNTFFPEGHRLIISLEVNQKSAG